MQTDLFGDVEHPETGDPLDLSSARFVSLTGNDLTVYLPTEMIWYKGPDGERRAKEIGDSAVNFDAGLYPIADGDTLSFAEAKLLTEHAHYGDLFKLAASERDVSETGGIEADETVQEPDLAEGEVMVNGRVMTEEEAIEAISGESGMTEEQVASQIDDVPTEAGGDELEVLTEPTNRTEALEVLASRGVDLSGAPGADATTEEIQAFARENGYLIEKYAE